MPATASMPVTAEMLQQLDSWLEGLDAASLHWLSGYIAGIARRRPAAPSGAERQGQAAGITVLYGSQTGHARQVAEALAQRLQQAGQPVRLLRADRYPQRELGQERLLYLVISTQGEGEPPDDARGLVEYIEGRRAPQLTGLRYAVLGLGDSSYPEFCAIGRRLDERLQSLGGQRLFARGEADVDVDTVAGPWLEQALRHAGDSRPADIGQAAPDTGAAPPAHDRARPFQAEVLTNQAITGRDSDRDIRHLELSLAGSGLRYEAGDALGVWAPQDPALVDGVLAATGLDPEQPVSLEGTTLPLRVWLTERRELTVLTRPFLQAHAALSGSALLRAALEPGAQQAFGALTGSRQVLDILLEHPAAWSAEALVRQLRPLAPRMYSIASSPRAVDEEVHLTVAHVRYETARGPRWGVASHHLRGLAEGCRASVFIETNDRFRLPSDPDRDIIMIGPGTGVAPFRAFIQERGLQGGRGRNWLFFGNPHAYSDFLYQREWHEALRSGLLHRLDVAFSRDQPHKVYVQHRLLEQGAEVYAWLEGGGCLYVCGDAGRMARDVHEALVTLVREHGHASEQAARTWIEALQQQGRYLRDIY